MTDGTINFMQVVGGHCFMCHEDYNGPYHQCTAGTASAKEKAQVFIQKIKNKLL